MKCELDNKWFLGNGFTKNCNYLCISMLDIDYCFKYADFRDDYGFYVEYTDSPNLHDEGVKYPVLFGLKKPEEIIDLMKLCKVVLGGE